MPSDSSPTEHIDRRGVDIDEAVTFYERVYASHDIHIDARQPTPSGGVTEPSVTPKCR